MSNAGTWWLLALFTLVLFLGIEAYVEQVRYDRRHGRPAPHTRRRS
jgi:hypothetical protein